MESPKISVIVPIYNVEEYLEESLICLLNQTFIKNMEIIMIDDGSSDNSRYISEKYALDYEKFHVIHKKNEGQAIARNLGLDLAKGEYIQFFDSDDYIDSQGIERLYKLAKKNDSDIVTSSFVRLRRYNITDSLYFKKGYKNIDKDIDAVKIEEYPELLWDILVCNKLYKREFIEKNNLRFNEGRVLYEDGPFALRAYTLTDKISVSKDTFYYWRIRESNNLSTTQQRFKIKNFKDRLKNLNVSKEILIQSDFSEKTNKELYFKWVYHDLNAFYRNFHKYDEKYFRELVEKTNEIISIIPEDVMDRLNSFQKVIYKMVEEGDIEGLVNFSSHYTELMDNPHIPEDLDEKYFKYIDFIKDASEEELIAKKEEIDFDEKNLYIAFSEKIKYMGDYPHKNKAKFLDNNNEEYPLDLNGNNQIILPINIIQEKKHGKIIIQYICNKFKKECYLKNPKREILEFDEFDIQIGILKNKLLSIDLRETEDVFITIDNIEFNNNTFEFHGKSNEKIVNVYIENLLNFDKIKYPVTYKKNLEEYDIKFAIQYRDILNQAVKKWEIFCESKFKSIQLRKKFKFYNGNSKIVFKNARNKILIEDDVFRNTEEELKIAEDIKNLRNEIESTKSQSDKEKATVANVWHLVEMTKKQLELREFFEENLDDFPKYDLDDEEQFVELLEKLKPAISTFTRYSKHNMTISISPKSDALIKEVMRKSGRGKLVSKIEQISKKEYFIE